jgi:hypothetical protein
MIDPADAPAVRLAPVERRNADRAKGQLGPRRPLHIESVDGCQRAVGLLGRLALGAAASSPGWLIDVGELVAPSEASAATVPTCQP